MVVGLIHDLFVILIAGLIAGAVFKRLGLSMLVGYLIAGAVVGHGGLALVAEGGEEIEYLARAGALLLLFAIGIEFSLEELARLSRFFFVGGRRRWFSLPFRSGWRACCLEFRGSRQS